MGVKLELNKAQLTIDAKNDRVGSLELRVKALLDTSRKYRDIEATGVKSVMQMTAF